jgi:transposase-like protein
MAKQRKLTDSEKNQIVQMYSSGLSAPKIAKVFQVRHSFILRNLAKLGIEKRYAFYRRFSEAEKAEIIKLYSEGYSAPQIAKKLQTKHRFILTVLEKQGIPRRIDGTRKGGRRTHTLDESVFDTITEESAYWIGFLMADGCIGSKKPVVSLCLADEDRHHVERFRSFLKSSHKISIDGDRFSQPDFVIGHPNFGELVR